jgi:hypothetical protein
MNLKILKLNNITEMKQPVFVSRDSQNIENFTKIKIKEFI